jgi:hypothetical protein
MTPCRPSKMHAEVAIDTVIESGRELAQDERAAIVSRIATALDLTLINGLEAFPVTSSAVNGCAPQPKSRSKSRSATFDLPVPPVQNENSARKSPGEDRGQSHWLTRKAPSLYRGASHGSNNPRLHSTKSRQHSPTASRRFTRKG